MTATQQDVTVENVISATVKLSNRDNSTRVYDIAANVVYGGAKVSAFEGGEVFRTTDEPNSAEGGARPMLASFSSYGERQIVFSAYDADPDETVEILNAVYAFIAASKNKVSQNTNLANI